MDNSRVVSARSDLVLLHGVVMSGAVWREVVPLLEPHHRVHAPTALGHRGGPAARRRPARFADVVDDAERHLDELGLERPHLAGNSMGGWVALELAARGRAASVCALSPAGLWHGDTAAHSGATRKLRRLVWLARVTRPVAPPFLRIPPVRRLVLRDVAERGDRLAAADAVRTALDTAGCAVAMDLLGSDEALTDRTPDCPVTVAWSEHDAILPVERFGPIVRERLPRAAFRVLPGVGHVPMIDDPNLVAATVLDSTHAG
ncbi:alpha/beta hydrolase [Nocardia sp. NPDC050697]|uniref:alpha/beta fold hydrolase n=1 Tax=Nocardia sp. NPDC050697 TaxID=3155158 RepID=UPI0033F870B1